MTTLDQRRAQKAFECVNRIAQQKDEALKKKYSTQCRRLPQLIQQCGLCQTVAFLESKPKEAAMKQALADLAANALQDEKEADHRTSESFASKCRTMDVQDYQWLSRNALNCAAWMKRYAEALLPSGEN